MTNAKHLSLTVEHYTPPLYKAKAKKVMQSIALDPCSCLLAQTLGKADEFYSEENDGLNAMWWGGVFINPPGGLRAKQSNMRLWFRMALDKWLSGEIKQCYFLAFQQSVFRLNPEIFEYQLPFVVPSQRIRFWTTPFDLLKPIIKKHRGESAIDECWIASQCEIHWFSDGSKRAEEIFKLGPGALTSLFRHFEKCQKKGNWVESIYGVLLPSQSPPHDNAIIYLPPKDPLATQRFYQIHSDVAAIPRLYRVVEAA